MAAGDDALYGTTFWICYAANLSLTMAFSALFRYADFVDYLGGDELDLGFIVGVGMFGALTVRVAQGVAIDRYGPRLVWLVSLACFTASALAHLAIDRVDTPWIYLARMLMTTGSAGAFGASLTFVSLRVPVNRMAEMIGTLGTSGFIGLGLGPTLADLLCAPAGQEHLSIARMFLAASALSVAAFALVCLGTRQSAARRPSRRPPLLAVLSRYHPGTLLLVSLGTGLTLGLPHVFLRAYAAELAIPRIKTYFLVYAGIAFAVRVLTRRMPDRAGVRPVILSGFAAAAVSMLLYFWVFNEASLAIPAVAAGTAHALLFPAVMAAGNASFPARYRGIATTLMFAMFDIGNLVGQPLMGVLVGLARRAGWPPYPTMFAAMALFLIAIAAIYAAAGRETQGSSESRRRRSHRRPGS